MRLTIIKEDSLVGVDGQFRRVDLTALDPEIRVIQWDDSVSTGHIEYFDDSVANDQVSSFSAQSYVDLWTMAAPPPAEPVDPRLSMTVSRFQAKAAMLNAGILTQAEAYFSGTSSTALEKLAWVEAVDFYRLSPLVVATGVALGLTDAQLDDLFIAAKGVTI